MISPQEFKQAFEAAFLVNRRWLLWNTAPRRTAYMNAYIYRTLANSFPGTEVEYEYENIDAVLYKNKPADEITYADIVVAIEHENDITTIGRELANFASHTFPLNVLISYTGSRNQWIISRHSTTLNTISGQMLFILLPENQKLEKYQRGGNLQWDYLLYNGGILQPV